MAILAVVAACSAPEMVTVDGIMAAVNGALTTVESFDVLTTEGETISVVPAPFGDFDFPLPVHVALKLVDGLCNSSTRHGPDVFESHSLMY